MNAKNDGITQEASSLPSLANVHALPTAKK